MKNGPVRGHFFLAENTPGILRGDAVFVVQFNNSPVSKAVVWSVYVFTGAMFINFAR
jgi:hypothetical protein